MFKNKKTQKIDEIDTVIGPGTKFNGDIEAIGIVRVDGTFTGNIVTQGDVIIGDNGTVIGIVTARNMIVAGTSNAELNCSGKLEIKSQGRVIGDVFVDSIIIEERAIFKGKCSMNYNQETQKEIVND